MDIEPPAAKTRPHYRFITRWGGPALFGALGGWHVSGTEHIPAEGAALVCSNHVSYADPPVVGIALRRRCCYMAKASLFDIPGLRYFIRKSYSYPVDQEGGGRQAIRIATELLGAGELVVIFPEGTRSPDGELMAGEPGAALIASRAGVPIIPTAVWGTDVLLPLHASRLYRCPIYVRFGPRLEIPEPHDGRRLRKDELREITSELMSLIGGLQEQIRDDVPDRWLEREARLKASWREKQPIASVRGQREEDDAQ